MDELNKGLEVAWTGPGAAAALARCRAQLAAWEIVPPNVEPLILDFGLGRFQETGLIEFWLANEAAAGYCGKYLFVFDGQSCPRHQHRTKHETFHLVKGRACLDIDGEEQILEPGDTVAVGPGQVHGFTGLGPVLLLELSMPCEVDDNAFEDRHIPIGSNYAGDHDEH